MTTVERFDLGVLVRLARLDQAQLQATFVPLGWRSTSGAQRTAMIHMEALGAAVDEPFELTSRGLWVVLKYSGLIDRPFP